MMKLRWRINATNATALVRFEIKNAFQILFSTKLLYILVPDE